MPEDGPQLTCDAMQRAWDQRRLAPPDGGLALLHLARDSTDGNAHIRGEFVNCNGFDGVLHSVLRYPSGRPMATRTVRLDTEAEAALREIRQRTGMPISEALKRGLRALQERIMHDVKRTPYEVYRELDLGPGGYAIAPSTETRRGVTEALRKKLGRP